MLSGDSMEATILDKLVEWIWAPMFAAVADLYRRHFSTTRSLDQNTASVDKAVSILKNNLDHQDANRISDLASHDKSTEDLNNLLQLHHKVIMDRIDSLEREIRDVESRLIDRIKSNGRSANGAN